MTDNTYFEEFIGRDKDEVFTELSETNSSVYLVPKGSFVTMDYKPFRIRIYYDPDSNKVVRVQNG